MHERARVDGSRSACAHDDVDAASARGTEVSEFAARVGAATRRDWLVRGCLRSAPAPPCTTSRGVLREPAPRARSSYTTRDPVPLPAPAHVPALGRALHASRARAFALGRERGVRLHAPARRRALGPGPVPRPGRRTRVLRLRSRPTSRPRGSPPPRPSLRSSIRCATPPRSPRCLPAPPRPVRAGPARRCSPRASSRCSMSSSARAAIRCRTAPMPPVTSFVSRRRPAAPSTPSFASRGVSLRGVPRARWPCPSTAPTGAGLEEVARALHPFAPVPLWDLGEWGGDPARPPSGAGYRRGLDYPTGRADRLAAYFPSVVARLDPVRCSMSHHLGRPATYPVARVEDLPRVSLRAISLRVYHDFSYQALRLVMVALRLCAHARFVCDRWLEGGGGAAARGVARGQSPPLGGARSSARCARSPPSPPLLFENLFLELLGELKLPPLLLLLIEAKSAELWDVHARGALATVWGVRPGMRDGVDQAGPAPDLEHRAATYD